MNKFTIAALATSFLCFCAIGEFGGTLTNPATKDDTTFLLIAATFTVLLLCLSVFFWWKSLKK